MTSSDERREVAATLRDAKRKCESRGYPWMCDDLCLAIGYEHDYEADNGIFDRLADLIDPTCEVESVEPIEYGEFNQTIGFFFKLTCGHGVTRPQEDMPPAYCDECGARVVSDDDQR